MNTVKHLIEAGSLIQARYPVEAGCHLIVPTIQQNKKLPVNMFRSVRSAVTAIAHTMYRKRLLPWYDKLTMF